MWGMCYVARRVCAVGRPKCNQVPCNGDINKDAVHTLRSSVHPLFFSNTSRQFGRSKANFGDLSSFGLFSTFYTPSSVHFICKLF